MGLDDDRPPVPRLQSSKRPSLRVEINSKPRDNEAGYLHSDDDDSSSSADDPSQMSQSSGISGGRTVPQDSASQEQDCSTEWMFEGYISFPNRCEVDREDNGPVPDENHEIRQEFHEIRQYGSAGEAQSTKSTSESARPGYLNTAWSKRTWISRTPRLISIHSLLKSSNILSQL